MTDSMEYESSLFLQVAESMITHNVNTAIKYAAIGVDCYLDDPFLMKIPIVKTIAGTATGAKIRDAHFAKKIMIFLAAFQSGNLSEDTLHDFRIRFGDDEKYREKLLEQIMIYNDRFIEAEKSGIFANLLLAHLNNNISWEEWLSVSFSLERFDLTAAKEFTAVCASPASSVTDNAACAIVAAGLARQDGTSLQINTRGDLLYKYGINA
jgi:hypothetical protein